MVLVAAYAQSGRQEDAEAALRTYVEHRGREFAAHGLAVPGHGLSELAGGFRAMWRRQADWDRLAKGLRLAGLPD